MSEAERYFHEMMCIDLEKYLISKNAKNPHKKMPPRAENIFYNDIYNEIAKSAELVLKELKDPFEDIDLANLSGVYFGMNKNKDENGNYLLNL